MNLKENKYEARLSRLAFLINALNAQSAISLAYELALNTYFPLQKTSSNDEGDESIIYQEFGVRSCLNDQDPIEGMGSWNIEITRVGHAHVDSGEFDSSYYPTGISFLSHTPHSHPDAEDDPLYWTALRHAQKEQDLLNSDTTSSPSQPRSTHPLKL